MSYEDIAERAMLAASDPHLSAEAYRAALTDICNMALASAPGETGERLITKAWCERAAEREHAAGDPDVTAGSEATFVAAVALFDFKAHLQRQREFSERTFGPGARTAGVIDHIRKELREIEAEPNDLREWIDVVILALDGAWRAGFDPDEIVDTLVTKQTRNEARAWPDWRMAPADKAIEHERTAPAAPVATIAPGETGERRFSLAPVVYDGNGGTTRSILMAGRLASIGQLYDVSLSPAFERMFTAPAASVASGTPESAPLVPAAAFAANAVIKYAEWCGGVHDDGCPADDTCECSGKWINDGVTDAVKCLRMQADLRWVLDNVYTIARRELRRLEKLADTGTAQERWGHVLRLCEKVGSVPSGVLRDNGGSMPLSPAPAPEEPPNHYEYRYT